MQEIEEVGEERRWRNWSLLFELSYVLVRTGLYS